MYALNVEIKNNLDAQYAAKVAKKQDVDMEVSDTLSRAYSAKGGGKRRWQTDKAPNTQYQDPHEAHPTKTTLSFTTISLRKGNNCTSQRLQRNTRSTKKRGKRSQIAETTRKAHRSSRRNYHRRRFAWCKSNIGTKHMDLEKGAVWATVASTSPIDLLLSPWKMPRMRAITCIWIILTIESVHLFCTKFCMVRLCTSHL